MATLGPAPKVASLRLASSVDIDTRTGEVHINGERLGFYIADEPIIVETHRGISKLRLTILVDGPITTDD